MKTLLFLIFAQLTLLSLVASCGKTLLENSPIEGNSFLNATPAHYFQITQKVVIEVYYEPGAAPFTEERIGGLPYWNILEDNLSALFQYRSTKPLITVPKNIQQMTQIPSQNKIWWTPEDVLALNSAYKQGNTTLSEAHFYIYFLQGNSKNSNNVIAFNINGTPVIAVFKNVITQTGGPIVQRYVEQSTLVHEMGHALGLVNNGIPMKIPHQDVDHGSHTKNANCVMHWQNEGLSDLMNYVQKYISTNSTVMWGPEVLADAQAFSK